MFHDADREASEGKDSAFDALVLSCASLSSAFAIIFEAGFVRADLLLTALAAVAGNVKVMHDTPSWSFLLATKSDFVAREAVDVVDDVPN